MFVAMACVFLLGACSPTHNAPTPTQEVLAVSVPPLVQSTARAPTVIDAGKIAELMGLLGAFGVQAVTQLGAFATELRKLGAQI